MSSILLAIKARVAAAKRNVSRSELIRQAMQRFLDEIELHTNGGDQNVESNDNIASYGDSDHFAASPTTAE